MRVSRCIVGGMLVSAIAGCGGSTGIASATSPGPTLTRTTPAPVDAAQQARGTDDPEAPPEANAVDARPSFGHADLDPSNDHEQGPPEALEDCEARLEAAGVTFTPARIGLSGKRDGVHTCGAAQVVRFRRGPGRVRYGSAPLVTCKMALALADFERVLQEEAQRWLGSRVERIDHLGTYNCRKMVNYDLISEHSFANGIDLRRFHLEDGTTVTVLKHFRPSERDPDDPKSMFLRALANRLYDEDVFSVVVTPFFDRLHRNHMHVDLARYRVDGSRP